MEHESFGYVMLIYGIRVLSLFGMRLLFLAKTCVSVIKEEMMLSGHTALHLTSNLFLLFTAATWVDVKDKCCGVYNQEYLIKFHTCCLCIISCNCRV